MRRRARVGPPVDEAEDEGFYQDEFLPPKPPARYRGRGRGKGRPRGASRHRQRELQEDEPTYQDFEEAAYIPEVPQSAVPIPPTVPQMQPMYQQGMSDPEAALFYTRVDKISFDDTSDPLDFLHAIEMRTQTTHTKYQRIMIVELSVEGPALDWFVQVIQPHMTTMMWGSVSREIHETFLSKAYTDEFQTQTD